MTRYAILGIAKVVGILAALAFLGRAVRAAWSEVASVPGAVAWPTFGLAVVGLGASYLLFAGLWKSVASDLGADVRFGHTVQLWAFSNLGRYLPGKVWQVVGLVVVARDLGVSAPLAASVSVVALGYTIATGSLLATVLVPDYLAARPGIGWVVWIAAASLLVPTLRPAVVNWLLQKLTVTRTEDGRRITHAITLRWAASFVGMWVIHGVTFMLVADAVVDVQWARFAEYTGLWCLSYVAGVVAVFAPGGIGVRESVLAHLLQMRDLHPDSANLLAVLTRLATLFGEALMIGLAVALRRRGRGIS